MSIEMDYVLKRSRVIEAARAVGMALPEVVGWDEYERLFGVMVATLRDLDAAEREPPKKKVYHDDWMGGYYKEDAVEAVDYIQAANPDGGWPDPPIGVTTTATHDSHPFEGKAESAGKPRGVFEIERVDNGYIVTLWGGGCDACLAFEDASGVVNEVMLWLGYGEVEKDEEEPVYVLTEKGRAVARGLH